ncbi:hypothetical protein Tco_1025700 [Tanacetum coccineum]
MTWHATGKCTKPGKMQHSVDGRAWKNFNTKYPNFSKEPRNVRLRLAADGFNPLAGDIDNIRSASVVMYEREFFYADIIDDEDALPHDLADSDDEDLVNVEDDDGVEVVYSSEEED